MGTHGGGIERSVGDQHPVLRARETDGRMSRDSARFIPSRFRNMGARALYHDPIPMGLIAVAFLLGTAALLEISVPIPLLIASFCGTALVYGIDRGIIASPEDRLNRPDRRQWMEGHQMWVRVEVVMLTIGAAVALPFLRRSTLLGITALAALVGLHLVSVGHWKRPVKASTIGKPLAIAGAWAVGGTLFPVLEAGHPIGRGDVALIGYRVLFLLPNVIVADWGDRHGDMSAGLATWAEGKTLYSVRFVSTALLTVAGAGAVLAVVNFGAPLVLFLDALGLVAMGMAVWKLRPGYSPLHSFLLDAVVAWPVLVWVWTQVIT